MNANELIHRWRERRWQILKTLDPNLLAEYRQLGRNIKAVLDELLAAKKVADPFSLLGPVEGMFDHIFAHIVPRIPLAQQKEKLIAFLKEHGPATRREISSGARIPRGSLSQLLRGAEFEQVRHGLWGLKKDCE